MIKHLHIHGIVQGVGYRAGFDTQARTLGVSGWARNRRDASVEAMIHGDNAVIQQLIAWAHIAGRPRRGSRASMLSKRTTR